MILGAKTVAGAPRWAVLVAYLTPVTVLPAALWRSAVGFGADLGMPQAWRDFHQVPGDGSAYVIGLSLGSLGAAALTLGLVHRWGEEVPRWVPGFGGRRLPVLPVVTVATVGAILVAVTCVLSVVNWNAIIGHRGMPDLGWYALASAAYAPALLWAPLLLAATWAYWWRRTRPNSAVGT